MLNQLELRAVLLKNVEDLHRIYNNISGLKIGSLYHVQYVVMDRCQLTEEPDYRNPFDHSKWQWYISSRPHLVGRLKGYSHYAGTLRVSASFQLLATDITRTYQRGVETKSGDATRTVEIPPVLLGESFDDPSLIDYHTHDRGGYVVALREVLQDDLLAYVGDPIKTTLFKRLLSGGTIRARKAK